MVTEKIIQSCKRKFGDLIDYRIRLQDYTDEEFMKAYHAVKPNSWADMFVYLTNSNEDPEVQAHLRGFESAAEREDMLARIKGLQKQLQEQMND